MNVLVNMTKGEVFFVMKLDASALATNVDKFCKRNYTTYNVAINTWIRIVEDSCGFKAARILKSAIMQIGLAATIDGCCSSANSLITGTGELADYARPLITEDEKVTLQCLRYLKRFTPIGCDKLDGTTMTAFLELNATRKGEPSVIHYRGRVIDRTWEAPRWLLKRVSDYCYEILSPYEYNDDLSSFTNGTTAEGLKTKLDKLTMLSEYEPNLYGSPMYPISDSRKEWEDGVVKGVLVPKNYKRKRVIAETETVPNYHLNGIRKAIERCFPQTELGRRIHLDDQGMNQELARLGSVYNCYATIDLSGASDSISQYFARRVLPENVFADIDRWNATWLEINGRKVRRHIFQTSGNPTTFCVETIIFLAICQVATDLYTEFTGLTALQPITYGDDMIVDTGVYDTVVDLLELLGFTVNTEKSFSSESDYRESCGVEYRLGIDVSTVYYPRQPIGDDDVSLASLIALQHRIFAFSSAEMWLTDFVRSAFRDRKLDITTSPIGTDCDDLWDYIPFFRLINAPFDHSKQTECDQKRELHLSLKAEYAKRQLTPGESTILEMYYYAEFLHNGAPLIDCDDTLAGYLAKVHHWTKSVKDVQRDSGIPEMAWKPTKR